MTAWDVGMGLRGERIWVSPGLGRKSTGTQMLITKPRMRTRVKLRGGVGRRSQEEGGGEREDLGQESEE